jgi:hypothetical protein
MNTVSVQLCSLVQVFLRDEFLEIELEGNRKKLFRKVKPFCISTNSVWKCLIPDLTSFSDAEVAYIHPHVYYAILPMIFNICVVFLAN